MAKKKKTQLKPVARGFATQSVPKKVVEIVADPDLDSSSPTVPPSPAPEEASGAAAGAASSGIRPTEGDQSDATKQAEESALQDLVDKHQDRTEKEVVRTVKVRRTSSQLYVSIESHVTKDHRAGASFHGVTPQTDIGGILR